MLRLHVPVPVVYRYNHFLIHHSLSSFMWELSKAHFTRTSPSVPYLLFYTHGLSKSQQRFTKYCFLLTLYAKKNEPPYGSPPCHILHTILKVFPFLSKRILYVLFRYRKNCYQTENVFHDNICPFCITYFFADDIKQIRYKRCRYTCKDS